MSGARHPKRSWFVGFVAASLGLAIALYMAGLASALPAWLIATNAVAMASWAFDKWSAGRGGSRVPEAILHCMAVLGAAPASLASMLLFRHKIRKWQFPVLHALVLVAWIGSLAWLQRR